ncbi:MAG: serine dehydratase [Flavobacteriales bacterium]|jgi:threonine dehydratase|nr:serine dehydratase [Flavobacteriales bacterium]|tara:strand:- start:6814 stop:7764 length:951 start_codon:yes stop_codon:yes gene_type:complete
MTASLTEVPTAQDIKAAAQRIAPYINRTPSFSSLRFNELACGEYLLKGEHLQLTGAFKARGAMNAILVHQSKALSSGVITHSSGNHGAALAWAASQVGAKAYIIMPSNAPKSKIASVRHYGGVITFCEPTLEARETTATRIQKETSAYLIHPYDDYDIIAGQATATYELLKDNPEIEHLFVPVGGGGLLSGAALANYYFGNAKLYGCEPELARDAYDGFVSGKRVLVKNSETIADGLKTSLGKKNFPIIKSHVNQIILLTEKEIETGWHICLETTKQFIEPSAATGVAAALKMKTKGVCGILLCGGNMDVRKFTLR